MANYYVRSAAVGTGTGASWANAYTTIAAALTARLAGDVFWVANDHAESQGSIITLTSPGTVSAPCLILCVNTHVTEPPTALVTTPTATVSTAGNFAIAFAAGYAYVYGISFIVGTGGASGTASITFTNTAAHGWKLENCKLTLAATGTSSRISVGAASNVTNYYRDEWINTVVKFAQVLHSISIVQDVFFWRNTPAAIDVAGTIPTNLFTEIQPASARIEISGVDLSALGSGKNLVLVSNSCNPVFYFRNCRLGASVTVINGTIPGPEATTVYLDNCDSGNTNYRMEHYKFQGSIVQETTKVRTSGASDGTTPLSHKFVTLTSGPTLFSPLEGPWLSAWNETVTQVTATVEVLHDSLTALTDAEIWLEVEYLGTSSLPQSVYSSDRVADAMATAADQTTSTAAWTTTGITNVNKQKLEVPFTPAIKGPIRWRVCMAKANYTVYVDPVASGLATPSRDYLIPGTAYVNETGSGGLLVHPGLAGGMRG